MIEIKNLNKYYSKGRSNEVHAVNDVSMSLPDNGMVAIFGKSGCGKTTLLNIIGGLDNAQDGSVMLDGKQVSPDSDVLRNRSVGYIFQNYNLQKTLTVFDNVAASLRLCGVKDEKYIEKRVMAALKSVDMDKYRNRLPDALSGGQQQRIAIARAIVKNPKLILADEPTGNLDEHNTIMVMDLLKQISKQHLVLLVTHEEKLVDLYCDKVIEVVDGKVTSSRENTVTEGYFGRGSSDVYLGDMPCEKIENSDICLEYFGDKKDMPSKLRIISHGGMLYIKADEGLRLKLIDKGSELKIHEGKFEEVKRQEQKELDPVLASPVPEGKTGRMYNFKGAVKSGFNSSFGKTRKSKKILIAGLLIFSAIIVFMVSSFGVIFKQIKDIKTQYNDGMVYLRDGGSDREYISSLLDSGKADLAWYDYEIYDIPYDMVTYSFCIGNFETFTEDYNLYFKAEALPLPEKVIGDKTLLFGKGAIENDNEIIITSGYADKLLEASNVGYIDSYEDLLYISASERTWDSNPDSRYTVVGIVEDENVSVYFSDYEFVSQKLGYTSRYFNGSIFTDVEHSGTSLEPLEDGSVYINPTMFQLSGNFDKEVGDKILINGIEFTVKGFANTTGEENEEAFNRFVIGKYGSLVTESISSYAGHAYGEDVSNFEVWSEMNQSDDRALFESFLTELQNEYDDFCKQEMTEYLMNYNKSMPAVIMTTNDLYRLIASNGEYDECFGINSINFEEDKSSVYIYSDDAEGLYSEMSGKYGSGSLINSDDMYEYWSREYRNGFITKSITLVVILALMSLCLYFIMRSAIMSDIKEVGINRAIGVSRKNIVYRYFIETLVLFTLTIFVGYLASSAFVRGLMAVSNITLSFMYYPIWLAGATLVVMLIISIICGLIPIRSLLSKSPAEILAKYDI